MSGRVTELLPCPFCGGEAERIDFGQGDAENEGGSCIACTKCQSSGPVEFGYKENFISNWNRRAAPHMPKADAVDLSDEQCEAIFQAVSRAGLTRDVKTPEVMRHIVRQAIIDSSRSKP